MDLDEPAVLGNLKISQKTVDFLASDAASYIVGEVISVDGNVVLDSVSKREALLGF
ncbi:MAG: hypothetical protein ACFFCW_14195 [Candidatus Hodarchaeota archaeon]